MNAVENQNKQNGNICIHSTWGFPGDLDGKGSACITGDPSLIPGLGRSPGNGNGNHSSIIAWRIPCREEPGRLYSMGLQTVGDN